MKIIAKSNSINGNENGDLLVTFQVAERYRKELSKKLKKDEEYSLEIKKIKDKRSINQNRFMWKLLTQIAEVQNGDKDAENIYTQALIRSNTSSDYICALEATEEVLRKNFRAIRFIKKIVVNDKELNMYQVFIGSSKFDVKEMNTLIDCVLDIANENGIETEYWRGVLK